MTRTNETPAPAAPDAASSTPALMQGAMAVGRNPHYRPPKMRWNTVEIIAQEGTVFGIVADRGGVLSLIVRRQDEPWPHGTEPTDGVNVIAPGHRCYGVRSDDTEADALAPPPSPTAAAGTTAREPEVSP